MPILLLIKASNRRKPGTYTFNVFRGEPRCQ